MIVIELFAGVGGFRLGLEGYKPDAKSPHYSLIRGFKKGQVKTRLLNEGYFITGAANQYEPSTKSAQHAADIYSNRFKDNTLINEDINDVSAEKFLNTIQLNIPDSRQDENIMLVGGFPCQDYSVAGRKDLSKGMQGKKGVLWWNIFNLIWDLKKLKRQPSLVLLENVDRLLKSPAQKRGKDFTILTLCLHYLGYDVEYKVVNGGDYGFPQRRKRVFIMANLRSTRLKDNILASAFPQKPVMLLNSEKVFKENLNLTDLENLLFDYSNKKKIKFADFGNYGKLINGTLHTYKVKALYTGKRYALKDILQREKIDGCVDDEFFVSNDELEKWEIAKGASKITRRGLNRDTGQKDFVYNYSVGKMSTFDELHKPIRTIITSEGGKAPSRTKHLIKIENDEMGKFRSGMRRLTPLEMERANCFPDNFTKLKPVGDARRAFIMGNALIIGLVELIRNSIIENLE